MDDDDDAEEDSSAVAEDSDDEDSVEGAKEEDGKEEEEERMEVRIKVWRSKRKKNGGRGAKEEIKMKVEEEDEMAEVKEEEEEEEKGGGVPVITMKGYYARLVQTNKYNRPKKVKEDKEKDRDDVPMMTTPVSSAPDLVTMNSTDETQEDYNNNDNDDNENDDDDDDDNNQAPQVEVINGQVTIAEDSLLANPTSHTSTALIDIGFGDAVVNNNNANGLGIVRAQHDLFRPGKGPNDEWRKNGLRGGWRRQRRFTGRCDSAARTSG